MADMITPDTNALDVNATRASHRSSRRRSNSWVRVLVLAPVIALAAACGGGGDDSSDTTPATTTTVVLTSEGRLRIRPVVTLLPIDGMPLNPFGDDDPAEPAVAPNIDSTVAYDLGPSVADESDVVDAVAAPGAAGEWQITVTLTDDAAAAVRALGEICLAQAEGCERGQIAVTVDGFVVTAVPVTGDLGATVVLSGGLNDEQATVIADALG